MILDVWIYSLYLTEGIVFVWWGSMLILYQMYLLDNYPKFKISFIRLWQNHKQNFCQIWMISSCRASWQLPWWVSVLSVILKSFIDLSDILPNNRLLNSVSHASLSWLIPLKNDLCNFSVNGFSWRMQMRQSKENSVKTAELLLFKVNPIHYTSWEAWMTDCWKEYFFDDAQKNVGLRVCKLL